MHKNLINRLFLSISELPGWSSQRKMSPLKTEEYRSAGPDSKQAGVVALLFPDTNDELQLVYIKRTSHHPDDKHGGQVSFPGGQMDSNDKDIAQTAVRELEEELGIPPSAITLIGPLSPIFVFVSNFNVQPYLAYMDKAPVFSPEPVEVDYPIVVPVSALLSGSITGTTEIKIRDIIMKEVPYYDVNGDILWGATAMITSELLDILSKSNA